MEAEKLSGARRRLGKLLFGIAACGMLASCANLIGPRQVEVPLHKLQAGLDRRFPVDERLLELFEIRLTRPQVAILPEQDRVALTMHAAISPPFTDRAWNGSVAFSGRLYVDPSRAAVMMAEPRVDRFAFDGMGDSGQRQLTRVANVLMEKVITDLPVYSFRPDDLRYAGVRFVPTSIRARPGALVVTLEPVK